MPSENDPQSLTFNQYGILLREINALRDEQRQNIASIRDDYREANAAITRILGDHETRIRRNETLTIIGVTVTIIAIIVVGAVLVILVRG